MSAADDHLQNYRFISRVSIFHLNSKISRGCEQILIVEVNLITTNAMIIPRFIIIPCVCAECSKDAVEVM